MFFFLPFTIFQYVLSCLHVQRIISLINMKCPFLTFGNVFRDEFRLVITGIPAMCHLLFQLFRHLFVEVKIFKHGSREKQKNLKCL